MNKFKIGDIVFAKANSSEFIKDESGQLFRVCGIMDSEHEIDGYIRINNGISERYMYYSYKFRKATKKEITKFNFDWMVNKLKGELDEI